MQTIVGASVSSNAMDAQARARSNLCMKLPHLSLDRELFKQRQL